jgi:hypothetical protein
MRALIGHILVECPNVARRTFVCRIVNAQDGVLMPASDGKRETVHTTCSFALESRTRLVLEAAMLRSVWLLPLAAPLNQGLSRV